jgi:ribonuclease P protein component
VKSKDSSFILSAFCLPMDRAFSLRSGSDFQRIWDDSKSWSHPLVVLRARANGKGTCRFGFVAGKSVGKATARNRAKRLMREAVRHRLPTITLGWDIILIARSGAGHAAFKDMDDAVQTLLRRANLIRNS